MTTPAARRGMAHRNGSSVRDRTGAPTTMMQCAAAALVPSPKVSRWRAGRRARDLAVRSPKSRFFKPQPSGWQAVPGSPGTPAGTGRCGEQVDIPAADDGRSHSNPPRNRPPRPARRPVCCPDPAASARPGRWPCAARLAQRGGRAGAHTHHGSRIVRRRANAARLRPLASIGCRPPCRDPAMQSRAIPSRSDCDVLVHRDVAAPSPSSA